MGKRFRFVSDDDFHHFIIPAECAEEWDRYREDPEKFGWNPPTWAKEMGMTVNNYTMLDPQEDK